METSRMQEIEKTATKLLEKYGYFPGVDSYVDIIDFAHSRHFVVGNAQLPDREDGFLAIGPVSKEDSAKGRIRKIIGVNAMRPLEFKRFIIAHELGHEILHYKAGEIYLHRENRTGKDAEENEADYFAAALLMPQASFARLYREYQDKGVPETSIYRKLAGTFRVPLESALRRVEEIKILT